MSNYDFNSNYNNCNSTYARLGSACNYNNSVLIDNRKFLPLDANVYNMFFTKTGKNELNQFEIDAIQQNIERNEISNVNVQKMPKLKTCCGNK